MLRTTTTKSAIFAAAGFPGRKKQASSCASHSGEISAAGPNSGEVPGPAPGSPILPAPSCATFKDRIPGPDGANYDPEALIFDQQAAIAAARRRAPAPS